MKYNQEWLKNYGSITMLERPTQGDPTLKNPYQYEMPYTAAQVFFKELKTLINELKHLNILIYTYQEVKPTKYGVRLQVSLEGYGGKKVEGFGNPNAIKKTPWDSITKQLTNLLKKHLTGTVKPYVAQWVANERFQYRFQTYIRYQT